MLTKEEEKEVKTLRSLQAEPLRWFTQEEFNRLEKLNEKQAKSATT